MKIAIHGLGRMGMQIARKLAEDGHTVIAHNRSLEPINEAVGYGAVAGTTKEDVVAAFGDEQVVLWVMLPADIVDAQVDEWLALIPKGSIIIDGGNSDFRKTKQLNQVIASAGSQLIDVGTSGGVWGYQNGFSMMAGGDNKDAFAVVEPALKTLAAPEGAYYHFGPSGSGHFVKMTHNAIEYGMMESLAEGYRMLKEGPYKELNLAAAGDVWQHHSVVTSWLNELSQAALAKNPELEGIDGFVAESGEARWTLEAAKEQGMELPSIQAAFDVRLASQKGETNFATKLLAAMRNAFGGHELNK
ncbi:MAG: gnd, 6-phosphogluconate dehydrogenase, decarboxylating [Candidatus Saccharibacteria bacterium]|nr:gnd, 6-phosphogluconate dehydrogenase, decarboxylating [Candidatus Saccharibacteria bacterium]